MRAGQPPDRGRRGAGADFSRPGRRTCSLFIHMPSAFAYPLAGTTLQLAVRDGARAVHGRPAHALPARAVSSAAPRRSTAWSTSAATPSTTTAGRAKQGLENWSYSHCLPYFKKSETRVKGGDDYRGSSGPLFVTTGAMREPALSRLHRGRSAGRLSRDRGHERLPAGGPRPDGHDDLQGPALERGDGLPAPGAAARQRRGEHARARHPRRVRGPPRGRRRVHEGRPRRHRAGAARGDPLRRRDQLAADCCMLSGIGNTDELQGAGHSGRASTFPAWARTCRTTSRPTCSTPASSRSRCTARRTRSPRRRSASNGCCPAPVSARPTISSPAASSAARPGVRHPDLQYHFLPMAVSYDGSRQPTRSRLSRPMSVRCARPAEATSSSSRPIRREHPRVLFNYLQTEQDRNEMRAASGSRARSSPEGVRSLPRRGARAWAGSPDRRRDRRLHPRARRRAPTIPRAPAAWAPTTWRSSMAAGACTELKDCASSMRRSCRDVVSGNLNVPTIMMAEKLADAIRGRAPLPPEQVPVWIHPSFETQQR